VLHGCRIGVVIPAYNESERIQTCLEAMPGYVDDVVMVDDASCDGTHVVARCANLPPSCRLDVTRHARNRGVGGAILTGYLRALSLGVDVAVVMAGDAQMHPDDMPALLLPVLRGEADYVKGNRLAWPGAERVVPPARLAGIRLLGGLTRLSTGLHDMHDFQCGYTALRTAAIADLDLSSVYPRYGFPNDFLNHVVLAGLRVAERPVRPIYAGERSDMSIPRVAVPIAGVLLRGIARRLRSTLWAGRGRGIEVSRSEPRDAPPTLGVAPERAARGSS